MRRRSSRRARPSHLRAVAAQAGSDAETESTCEMKRARVGETIDLWWEDRDQVFRGRIASAVGKASEQRFHISYDDGDEVVHTLDAMVWRRVGSSGPGGWIRPRDTSERLPVRRCRLKCGWRHGGRVAHGRRVRSASVSAASATAGLVCFLGEAIEADEEEAVSARSVRGVGEGMEDEVCSSTAEAKVEVEVEVEAKAEAVEAGSVSKGDENDVKNDFKNDSVKEGIEDGGGDADMSSATLPFCEAGLPNESFASLPCKKRHSLLYLLNEQ